ncbi:CPBP family intramembrane glutamic endopeptidase [Salicibibacter kimchii]|uniref:CPBP family intramembrane metalloprotease n=1 Tax=Salicibibacter kimchii TaxID=2099786 RepID=A0A345C1Q0_9BACI|nr:CPBP family intramembrane glutamic endopeptidase [Salicibibacter kimchii]AXF57131.1 CPBP family intramembrane metalloprotease [Salicibibacter kimchii]
MKNWFVLLLGAWATATIGIFLAVIAGDISEEQFRITGDGRQIIQATVMSVIIIPIILFLYRRLHKLTGKPNKPAYSFKRSHHFFTGFFLATVLAVISLFTASMIGWIDINQWHAPQYWISALLINMLIAFFYEALPEELALRGFVYDVLKHRFAVWLSIFAQSLVFVFFAFGHHILQVIVGMEPIEIILLSIPSYVLFFVFGIALALIREWTGSLWAAVGFHLGYLVMARFLIMPEEYGAPPIVSYQDTFMYLVGALFMITGIMLGGILLFLLFLLIKRLLRSR